MPPRSSFGWMSCFSLHSFDIFFQTDRDSSGTWSPIAFIAKVSIVHIDIDLLSAAKPFNFYRLASALAFISGIKSMSVNIIIVTWLKWLCFAGFDSSWCQTAILFISRMTPRQARPLNWTGEQLSDARIAKGIGRNFPGEGSRRVQGSHPFFKFKEGA